MTLTRNKIRFMSSMFYELEDSIRVALDIYNSKLYQLSDKYPEYRHSHDLLDFTDIMSINENDIDVRFSSSYSSYSKEFEVPIDWLFKDTRDEAMNNYINLNVVEPFLKEQKRKLAYQEEQERAEYNRLKKKFG